MAFVGYVCSSAEYQGKILALCEELLSDGLVDVEKEKEMDKVFALANAADSDNDNDDNSDSDNDNDSDSSSGWDESSHSDSSSENNNNNKNGKHNADSNKSAVDQALKAAAAECWVTVASAIDPEQV
jgi:hypothetical protein